MVAIGVLLFALAYSQINILYDKSYNTPYGTIRYFIANNTSTPIPGEFAVTTTDNLTGVWFTLNCSSNPTTCIDDYRLVLEMNGQPLNYTQPFYAGGVLPNCITPIYFAANNTTYNANIWVAAAQQEYPTNNYAQCPSQKLDFVIVSGTDCGRYFPMFYFLDLGQTQISVKPLIDPVDYPGSNFPFLLCFYPVNDQALFIPLDTVTLTTFYPIADINVIVKNFDPTPVNVTLNVTSTNYITPYFIYTDENGNTISGESINLTLPPATDKPGEVTLILRILANNATNATNITVSLTRGTTLVAAQNITVKVYDLQAKATGAGEEIFLIPLILSGLAFAIRRNE